MLSGHGAWAVVACELRAAGQGENGALARRRGLEHSEASQASQLSRADSQLGFCPLVLVASVFFFSVINMKQDKVEGILRILTQKPRKSNQKLSLSKSF